MRAEPTALAWIDLAVSPWSELETTRIGRLARQLGYHLYWPGPSILSLVDQVRAADVGAVIARLPRTST